MANETLSFNTANGETTAFVATPDESNGKAVIVIQEYWGLNEHIKNIAQRYADEGFTAIAPDLYRGMVTADFKEAGQLMKGLPRDRALRDLKGAVEFAVGMPGADKAKIGSIGRSR